VVILRTDALLAHPGATADGVIQARAIAIEGLGPLTKGKHPFHQRQGAPQQAHIHVRTIKTIVGAAETSPAGDEDAGVSLTPGDAEIGILFIIFQQDVEMGLILLDQIRFQGQGLGIAVRHDHLDVTHLPHHQADAGAMALGGLEVTADAVS